MTATRSLAAFRIRLGASLALAAMTAVACQEQSPVGVSSDIAATPITIEVELTWSEFAAALDVFGGYGSTAEVGTGVVARNYGGTLNAHTLVRFNGYPRSTLIRDSTGTNVTDTDLTITGGRVVAFFDTIASTNTGPVTLSLGGLQSIWNSRSASWTAAIDTTGNLTLWPEAGAGPVTELATAVWDPAEGDSVLFQLDSAEVAAWADTTDLSRGGRFELLTEGHRLKMRGASMRLDARSSVDPDTAVTLFTTSRAQTFIYDPQPTAPTDAVRIGGAPSWRSVVEFDMPTVLDGPAGFCAVIGCPHALSEAEVSYAAIVLTTRADGVAFQPTDSVRLDVRTVLSPSTLPKSPLGPSLVGDLFGRRIAPEAFGTGLGQRIEVPVTPFVRALVAGDDGRGGTPPSTMALMSITEPLSIAFASFFGPGSADEPRLRLILTIGSAVELP